MSLTFEKNVIENLCEMVWFHSIDDNFKLGTFGKAEQHGSRQFVPRARLLL